MYTICQSYSLTTTDCCYCSNQSMSEQLLKIIRPGCFAEAASHWAEQCGWQPRRRAGLTLLRVPPDWRGPAASRMGAAWRGLAAFNRVGLLRWVPLPLPWSRVLGQVCNSLIARSHASADFTGEMRTGEVYSEPHMQLMVGDGKEKKTPILLIKM